MDLFNNQVGRYQRTLALEKTRDEDTTIKLSNGAVIERAYNGGLIIVVK